MLEVCFNDSVKGALILAQHCQIEKDCFHFSLNEKQSKSIEGNMKNFKTQLFHWVE